ncbi:MAG: chromophore lyase CpcT/CpeT [Polyangiales bacterium]
MRNAMLGLLIIPALAGINVLGRSNRVAVAAPAARGDAFATQVARALAGEFRATSQRTSAGLLPAVHRTACAVDAPGLAANVVYVEDAFEGRRARPFSQRLLAVRPTLDGAVVHEFALIDPEAVAGLCATGVRPTVYRANTRERAGCEITLHRAGAVVTGATAPGRCESRINDAHHVERTLRVAEDAVEQTERGVDARGRAVWGGAAPAMRFSRR